MKNLVIYFLIPIFLFYNESLFASNGEWDYLWSKEERSDIAAVIDGVGEQKRSNGKVAILGLSYKGSAALFAATEINR